MKTAPVAETLGIGAQIACVKREIEMRERVYPSLVAKGKMKASAAEYEMMAMRAVLATLERTTAEWRPAP